MDLVERLRLHLVDALRDSHAALWTIEGWCVFATDGRRILVVRASGMSLFSYKVCVLDPDDGSVEVLADLPGVFA